MKKIAVIYLKKSSFVSKDIELLSKHYAVLPIHFNIRRLGTFMHAIWESDAIYIWFASYHALLTILITRFIHRPVIVVAGGYDVAYEPQFQYGLMSQPLTSRMVRFVLDHATVVLAVSETNQREIQNNAKYSASRLVYNIVDGTKFYPVGKKRDLVVTTCFVNRKNIGRKGLKTFLEAARQLQPLEFAVIGGLEDDIATELAAQKIGNVKYHWLCH